MNAVMGGMIPVMVILMSRDMRAMEPTSPLFWASMSAAALAGAVVAYPVNWWLVAKGLKHGMGTERAPGKGGGKVRHGSDDDAHPSGTAESRLNDSGKKSRPEAAGKAVEHGRHAGPPVTLAEKLLASLMTACRASGR